MGYRACYAESFPNDLDHKEMLLLTGFRVFGTPLLETRTPGCDAIHYFKPTVSGGWEQRRRSLRLESRAAPLKV
jgi:hypothetical protein